MKIISEKIFDFFNSLSECYSIIFAERKNYVGQKIRIKKNGNTGTIVRLFRHSEVIVELDPNYEKNEYDKNLYKYYFFDIEPYNNIKFYNYPVVYVTNTEKSVKT